MFILESGQIIHGNYENNENIEWPVNSDCESVHILSTMFATVGYDKVTIDGKEYSGKTEINQIVPTNFTVYFNSDYSETDDGFILNWNCTNWGEWSQAKDGTCNQERRPIRNGEKTKGHLKYRNNNSTCRK